MGEKGKRTMNFRLVFVMDVLDGVVVHATRGERDQYKPINRFSSIVRYSDPVQIVEELKPAELYIADLNRLMNTGDNRRILKDLRNRAESSKIMLDYGFNGFEDLKEAFEAKLADSFVLGTETTSLDVIAEATKSDMTVSVSVDLLHKEVRTRDKRLQIPPLELLKKLNEYPLQDVIVLELDRVGTKSGIDFEFLENAVAISEYDILCGGGVKNYEDIDAIKEIGVKGALVATAVHDGSIPVSTLRQTDSYHE
jgi:phosphoribosylformimino-5-aminoimidazole carboxamide ribotide isomerase